MRAIRKSSTDQSVVIRILDLDGLPNETIEHDSPGIALWYRREGGTKQTITPVALAALDSAHTDGGLEHISDGYYRLDLPDAAIASGANGVTVGGSATDTVGIASYIHLVDYDPQSETDLGLTSFDAQATALAAVKTDAETVLARLGNWTGTGFNTVLGALRAIAAKAVGLTPTDLSSGTTFANSTDSLEAVSERAGVQVLPVISTVNTGEVRGRKLVQYQFARLGPFTFSISDQTGTPVDLTGHDIVFIVESTHAEHLWQVVAIANGNVVTVSEDDSNTATAGEFRFVLRDLTDDTVVARGEFLIVPEADAE